MKTNKKIIYFSVGIFITLFVLVFTTNLKYFFLCSDHFIVECWREPGLRLIQISPPPSTTEEYIPCSNNNDCSVERMQNFCSPGHPNLLKCALKCAGARYYCGDDGYCKGCVCSLYSPAYWLTD